jgi:GNAT superfamily N-acetyltransferase/ribosomal protein S27AE
MNVRAATTDDTSRIHAVAESSFQTSYALSPQEIETIVEHVFADDELAERLDDGERRVLVVEAPDPEGQSTVAGFAEFDPDSTLRWLHVDPAFRGQGLADGLFDRIREETPDGSGPVTARILEESNEGDGFLERYGLERSGSTTFELGGESFVEHVYRLSGDSQNPNEPDVEVPSTVLVDGTEYPLDRDETVPGTVAPFFTLYESESADRRYGFFCSSCGSTAVSADGLDRLECNDCGNVHLAEQWDDAYL